VRINQPRQHRRVREIDHFAPAGIAAEPSSLFQCARRAQKISWFFRGASLIPSINVPARMTVSNAGDGGVD